MPWILLGLAVVFVVMFQRLRLYRLANAPRRPRAINPETGLMLFFAMFLLAKIFQVAAARVFGIEQVEPVPEVLAKLQLGGYVGQAVIVLAYLALCRRARRLDADVRPSPVRAILIGLGALLMVWPMVATAGNAAAWLLKIVWGIEPGVLAHELLVVFTESDRDVWFWLLVGCATILAGVFEEVMYRGLLQETLRRMRLGGWAAIVITSVLFTSVHIGGVELHALASLFVLSLGFGWAYERSGRLAAPITMHILFNVGNLGMALMMQGE